MIDELFDVGTATRADGSPSVSLTLIKGGKLRGAFLGATLICDALETDWLAGAAESNYRISNDAVWLT
jgi:hypothetical protein